ncbi:MAG: hypothetical protein ACI9S8_003208 [Chlamydiales bacterium]|jgi:hypothetical protein
MLGQNGKSNMKGSKTSGSSVKFDVNNSSGDGSGIAENILSIKPKEKMKNDGKIWAATNSITLAAD